MALYSCNLASVGKTTHAAGTAGAHLLYIGRESANAEILAEHMPRNPQLARTWMDQQERDDRKNARMIDKIRVALPRELNQEQRAQLIRDFMADCAQGQVPWYAGIHQTGKDAHNPHAHIAVRDRDIETGKRVLRLSDSARDREKIGLEPKAVEWVRERWEHHSNRALERAGHDVRVDRRTLEAQGIDRQPTIHIGPRAQHIDKEVNRPVSKKRFTGNGRMIDYPAIDQGRTRLERHAEILYFNLEKAARSKHFETSARAKFERAQQAQDRALENRLIARIRRRTTQERNLKRRFEQQVQKIRAGRDRKRKQARDKLRGKYTHAKATMRARHLKTRADLTGRQRRFTSRVRALIDITGRIRHQHKADRASLVARQKQERQQLAEKYRQSWSSARDAIAQRYRAKLDPINEQRRPALQKLREQHREAARQDDAERQRREAQREAERLRLDQAIQHRKQDQRDQAKTPDKTRADFDKAAFEDWLDREEKREQKRDKGKDRGDTGRKR